MRRGESRRCGPPWRRCDEPRGRAAPDPRRRGGERRGRAGRAADDPDQGGPAPCPVVAGVVSARPGPGGLDPDYTSPWPPGVRVRSVAVAGDTVTVDLAGLPVDSGGADPVTVRMSEEQLIWTATAASETTKVRLLVDGHGVTTFRGMPGAG